MMLSMPCFLHTYAPLSCPSAVINRIEQRIAEAAKLGFKQIVVPKSNMKGLDVSRFGIEVLPVSKVEEAFRLVFG